MSLLPMLFSDWWEELDHPHHVYDQHFGLGVHPDHLTMPTERFHPHQHYPRRHRHPALASHGHYYRPWGELMRRDNSSGGVSTVKSDKDNFQVSLDVQQFQPEEINVKIVDKYIVVEGNHEEKQDEHGYISRKFTRKYMVPEQCDLDKVESKLSSDGILTIAVARKEPPKLEGGERVISIEHTGKPALKEKQPEAKKVEEKK